MLEQWSGATVTQPPTDARIENQPGAAGSRLARTTGSTSPVDRILRWRLEHPEEYRAKKIAGLKGSAKAVAAARMVNLKYKQERLATRSKNPRSAKGVEFVPRKYSLRRLAAEYGICFTQVKNIIYRRQWTHI